MSWWQRSLVCVGVSILMMSAVEVIAQVDVPIVFVSRTLGPKPNPEMRRLAVETAESGRLIVREPDGTILMRTSTDPLRWLQGLNPDDVLSAEVGITRLEDLYRALTGDPGNHSATKGAS